MNFWKTVRRGLAFWLASFGKLPGMTRDLGFPSGERVLETGPDAAAPLLALPELNSGAQQLADEMAWGVVLHLETKSSTSSSLHRLRM